MDKDTAMQALAHLHEELGPEWADRLDYVSLLMETYTIRLHEILREIKALDLSADGQQSVGALLGYADHHRMVVLQGIKRFFLDNFDVDEERLRSVGK